MKSATVENTFKKFCDEGQERNEVISRRTNKIKRRSVHQVCCICLISFLRQMKSLPICFSFLLKHHYPLHHSKLECGSFYTLLCLPNSHSINYYKQIDLLLLDLKPLFHVYYCYFSSDMYLDNFLQSYHPLNSFFKLQPE